MPGQAHPADSAYMREMSEFRREKDRFFAASPQSPLPHEQRHGHFSGLSYYPPDPAFRVKAEVVPFAQPETVQMATSTGDIRPQVRYAELRFRIGDRDLRLAGFTDPYQHHTHELFVPFRDATSGQETYGAGRYLEVEREPPAHGPHSPTTAFNPPHNP